MALNLKWTRRTFMGSLGAARRHDAESRESFSAVLPASAGRAADKISGFGETGNVYEELGVTTVINGQGTMTVLGGSLDASGGRSGDGPRRPSFLQHSRSGSGRRQTHRRDAETSRWLHRARDFRRRGGDAVRTRGNTHRRQSGIHRTACRISPA